MFLDVIVFNTYRCVKLGEKLWHNLLIYHLNLVDESNLFCLLQGSFYFVIYIQIRPTVDSEYI